MTTNPPEGPEMQWSDPDKVVRYDAAFAIQWPVFPVKLSRDPEEILAARNETWRYAQDPRGVNELKLLPWREEPVNPPNAKDLLVGPGYLIPTSTEPTRVYDVFAERPRVLDAVHSLDLRRRSPWPEQLKEFVERFGFPGSTSHPFSMSPMGWRCGERLLDAMTDLSRLQSLWKSWQVLRDVEVRDLPVQDREGVKIFPPYVDQMAITELLLDVNGKLRRGTYPTLGFAEPKNGRLRFTTGLTCETLSDALYVQLYLDITESREYAKCRSCDAFFGRSHGNQAYCSTKCSNAHRQHELRARRRRDNAE